VDFADVRMVMNSSGVAIMGMGEAEGPDRAIDAVQKALDSPLLNDCDLTTAKGVLVNITSSKEDGGLTMAELSQIMEHVRSYTGGSFSKFKRGVVYDPNIGKKISVTIVATGFEISSLPRIEMRDEILDGDTWVITDNGEEEQEDNVAVSVATENQVYIKPEGKPALILEPSDDISKLEKVPAYIRRNKKLSGITEN
jgi:cell division protein FtsZ